VLETTIPHQVLGKFGSGAGAAEAGAGRHRRDRRRSGARGDYRRCGIPNVLTKSIGTHNPHNVVKATIVALEQLRDKAVARNARPGGGETLMRGHLRPVEKRPLRIRCGRPDTGVKGSFMDGWNDQDQADRSPSARRRSISASCGRWACARSIRWWSGRIRRRSAAW
jgi:hypothetical protein